MRPAQPATPILISAIGLPLPVSEKPGDLTIGTWRTQSIIDAAAQSGVDALSPTRADGRTAMR
jgi:hypothetical protein